MMNTVIFSKEKLMVWERRTDSEDKYSKMEIYI